uniref:Uncharacterized protein n=1 Tax=viral metagenome TaxID=1070528 RepID=A0A6M3IPT4_9ZZZZ
MGEIQDLIGIMQLSEMLNAPTEREKFDYRKQLDIYKQQMQGQLEAAKFTIDKFQEQWTKAATGAEREVISASAQAYVKLLPPTLKPSLGNIIGATEFSPARLKMRAFMEANPPPPQPSPEAIKNNPMLGAEWAFAQRDYQAKLENFSIGTPMPPRSGLTGIGPNLMAYRDPKDRISLLSYEQAAVESQAERQGVDYAKMIANNGRIYGDETEISVDGNVYKQRSWRNFFDEKDSGVDRPQVRVEPGKKELNHFLSSFAAAVADPDGFKPSGDLDNMAVFAKRWIEQRKPIWQLSQEHLRPRFGLNFILSEDVDTSRFGGDFFGDYAIAPGMTLRAFPGDVGYFGTVPVYRQSKADGGFNYISAGGKLASQEELDHFAKLGVEWTTSPGERISLEEKKAWHEYYNDPRVAFATQF